MKQLRSAAVGVRIPFRTSSCESNAPQEDIRNIVWWRRCVGNVVCFSNEGEGDVVVWLLFVEVVIIDVVMLLLLLLLLLLLMLECSVVVFVVVFCVGLLE